MGTVALADEERILSSWIINYFPPDGGRYLGKLIILERSVVFEARFDTSLPGRKHAVRFRSVNHGTLRFAKADFESVVVERGWFRERLVVTLRNGQKHVFCCGLMPLRKVAAALRQD